jgi:hypothetical protein
MVATRLRTEKKVQTKSKVKPLKTPVKKPKKKPQKRKTAPKSKAQPKRSITAPKRKPAQPKPKPKKTAPKRKAPPKPKAQPPKPKRKAPPVKQQPKPKAPPKQKNAKKVYIPSEKPAEVPNFKKIEDYKELNQVAVPPKFDPLPWNAITNDNPTGQKLLEEDPDDYAVGFDSDYYADTTRYLVKKHSKTACFIQPNPAWKVDTKNGYYWNLRLKGKPVWTLDPPSVKYSFEVDTNPYYIQEMRDCFQKPERFHAGWMSIHMYKEDGITFSWGHKNSFIIDTKENTFERFDPHGSGFESSNLDESVRVALQKFLEDNLNHVKLAEFHETCPARGPQKIEIDQATKIFNKGEAGYCGVWSLWFLDQRLDHPELSTSEVQRRAIEQWAQGGVFLRDFIQNYLRFVKKHSNARYSSGCNIL